MLARKLQDTHQVSDSLIEAVNKAINEGYEGRIMSHLKDEHGLKSPYFENGDLNVADHEHDAAQTALNDMHSTGSILVKPKVNRHSPPDENAAPLGSPLVPEAVEPSVLKGTKKIINEILVNAKNRLDEEKKILYILSTDLVVEKEEMLDEKRGRPRKDAVDTDNDSDDAGAGKNIVNQLRKVVDSGGTHRVSFESGKGKVNLDHAKRVLQMHGRMKPAHKLMLQDYCGKSPKHLAQVAGA